MIQWYKFKNFSSYRDECFVDFRVNNKVAHSYFDHEFANGDKLAKVMAVFGANGSGKSSLIKPLSFLSWFASHSFKTMKPDEQLPFMGHMATLNENSSFEVAYYFMDHEFQYQLEINAEQVLKEELKVKTSRLYSTVFSRELVNDQYIIKNNSKYTELSKKELTNAPNNCSLLSYTHRVFGKKNDPQSDLSLSIIEKAGLAFSLINSNLTFAGRNPHMVNLADATEAFAENPQRFSQLKQLLRQYDLGIIDLKIEELLVINESGEEVVRKVPFCIHSSRGNEFRLPMNMESSGTQSAYKLLATLLDILEIGGVAVLDEFDNDLHPQLTTTIVELFKNQSTNPQNAQLIFTSHSPEVLKLLRKQHIYFTEKSDCESEAWRADEIEGLKERDNLYSKYISGALGGVPEFD